MARSTPNATILQTTDEIEYDYADAASALDVGDLVVEASGDQVDAHGTTAEEKFPVRVCLEARENGMVARDPNGDNDAYASGDLAKYITLDGGEHVLVNLAAGSDLATSGDANVAEGDKLVSAGGSDPGKVKARNDGTDPDPDTAAVFEAKEAIDNSGAASGEWVKIRAEVIA